MTENEKLVFESALDTYGEEAQEKMLLEEMSELQKEICKMWRGKGNYADLADEIADVEIMLDQMKLRFHNGELVKERRDFKVARLSTRLAFHGILTEYGGEV